LQNLLIKVVVHNNVIITLLIHKCTFWCKSIS